MNTIDSFNRIFIEHILCANIVLGTTYISAKYSDCTLSVAYLLVRKKPTINKIYDTKSYKGI